MYNHDEAVERACREVDEKVESAKRELEAEAEAIKKGLRIGYTAKHQSALVEAVNKTLKATSHGELVDFQAWRISERQYIIWPTSKPREERKKMFYMEFGKDWRCVTFASEDFLTISRF